MKPDKLSIYDLFQKDRRYVVPLYQRAYVWNEIEQWEPLWVDIQRQAEACMASKTGSPRRSHFLGAVVLNVQKIVGSAVARSEIIDGQQRLACCELGWDRLALSCGVEQTNRRLGPDAGRGGIRTVVSIAMRRVGESPVLPIARIGCCVSPQPISYTRPQGRSR
jgi:hypothetical protein